MAYAATAEAPSVPELPAPNHPNAKWMGLIAGLSHNLVVGCVMGSFSVMIASVSSRLAITPGEALIAGPLVMLGAAVSAPIVGDLAARHSLRKLMFAGALLAMAGFALAAFVPGKIAYYGAYLLLMGPAMAVAGSIGPATLVTRWFDSHRGLALGLVHLNLIVAVMPLLCNWLLGAYGPIAVYAMMAVLIGAILVPVTLAVRDYPPGAEPQQASSPSGRAPGEMSLGEIARQPVFWMIATAASAIIAGIMVLTFTMVPLAESFGYSRGQGTLLQTVMSISGMAGSILFGWVADKLGGIKGLALLAAAFAVLLGLLLTGLPFAALMVVVGLLGVHGGGMVPNVSRALATCLGASSFSRAFGLSTLLSVPFTALGIGAMGLSLARTGSYNTAIGIVAGFILLAAPLAFAAGGRRLSPA